MKKIYKFNENNFDLVRLFAAFQVALHHAGRHLDILHDDSWLSKCIGASELFPGVPIFFFISGFLISRSYESNSDISRYSRNRFLRLFPGLIVCGILTMLSIFMSGYLNFDNIPTFDLLIWIGSQITVFQFYDPEFLAGYGIGKANGSLWTIYIEIQFYILIPLLYVILGRIFSDKKSFNFCLIAIAGAFLICHVLYYHFYDAKSIHFKLVKMSFVPYFYMFLLGMIFQRNFQFFERLLSGNFHWMLLIYLGLYYLMGLLFPVALGNTLNPLLFFVLCCVTFSFAFSCRFLGREILKGNDISYGLYIYHMPVVNCFIFFGLVGQWRWLVAALLSAIALAIFSWLIVEKPAMKFKSKPLRGQTIS